MADLLSQLRARVRQSSDAPGAIAARAGLPRSALLRLMRGRPMAVAGCEKLAQALGLRVKLEPTTRKGA